ncbi:MAG TPA: C4-dicarboxylate ABC transporter permease [Sediminispirochaeta sp.]|nr:C4-dicarboxylate ABC transporter permease [Sediminispirochaeta sp.]
MLDVAIAALLDVLQFHNLLASLIGVLFGLFIGSTPGLTISLGMVLMLPLTYTLNPVTSFCLLLGLFTSGMTGGSISAILLNIPGTPSASATAIDGHAMAKKGKAAEALGTAVTSSFTGGIMSLLALALVSPIIAKFALRFGSAELASLVFLGLTLICSFGQKSMIKGLLSGALGLVFMTVGLDPIMGMPRFTFNIVELQSGINFLPVMIGLFAIPQVIEGLMLGTDVIPKVQTKVTGVFGKITEIFKYMRYKVVAALLGIGVGSIPGAGGPIAVFLSYDYAKKIAPKDRAAKFGTGIPEGVAAPEAANNAMAGGAMIPMLTLGIPGDPVTAILLGALMVQGLTPGPLLFQDNPQFVYSVFWAFLVAMIFVLFVTLATIRVWIKLLKVPKRILLPIITIFCIVGTYSLQNSFADTSIMIFFGLIGFLMKKYEFPLVPMLLAIVLGPTFERYVRTALVTSNGDPAIFFVKPISLFFIVIALISFFTPLIKSYLKSRKG